MLELTRRRFLAFSGVAASGVLAAGVVGWSELASATARSSRRPGDGVLVVVTLYGGNDGLGMVIPAADEAYHRARPELAYRPEETLPLADGLGLNRALPGIKALWDTGRVAIVQGVGYPRPDRSHFRSMAIWQTASPTTPSGSGWLGRWLDRTGDDPVRALSLDPVLPPFLVGERATASTLPLDGLGLPGGAMGTALAALGAPDAADGPAQARVARSVADLGQVEAVVAPTVGRAMVAGGELARRLSLIGDLVEAGVPTRVYSVSLSGFDTHADERGTQEELLGELDGAVAPFAQRMSSTAAGRDVVMLVYSEFGRRVAANLSEGTDHGTANPVLLIGSRVRGGLRGPHPSLTDLDDGDLRAHTDFREVYAVVLGGVLAADPGPVLGDGWVRLTDLLTPT